MLSIHRVLRFKTGDKWARVQVIGVEKSTRMTKEGRGIEGVEEGWEVVLKCACGASWAVWWGDIKGTGRYIRDCGCGISKKEKKSQVVSVLIPREMLREVNRQAMEEGRTRNNMIVETIRKGMSK